MIYTIGTPTDIGGANTELWHTLRLWRQFGLDVTCVNTTGIRDRWRKRLASIGVAVLDVDVTKPRELSPLAESIVVGMCNQSFLRLAPILRGLDCQLVWAGCMNYLWPREVRFYEQYGLFDAYVFQSKFQKTRILSELVFYGPGNKNTAFAHITGAFFHDEFRFRPKTRQPGEPLVVGRISRADPEKFHRATWPLYSEIAPDRKARVLGWNRHVERRVGEPPDWAEVLPERAETPGRFYASLHLLAHLDGQAEENWPRVGLEAMAAGVPLVALRRGGWPEMIRHGVTGYLARDEQEWLTCCRHLARCESLRVRMAEAARAHVETLCRPEPIWSQWENLFEALQ